MALPQDITPVNPDLMDTLVKAKDAPWIESQPGMAWTKILWTGPESGGWANLRAPPPPFDSRCRHSQHRRGHGWRPDV